MTPEQEAAQRYDFGEPASAADFHGSGMFVPIIRFPKGDTWRLVRTGGMFPTREGAEDWAAKAIQHQRDQLARDLRKPGRNYVREQLGLPPLEEQPA